MIVAWQFTAWDLSEKAYPSRRDWMICISGLATARTAKNTINRPSHTVPLGQVALLTPFPGSKLPATIIQSLRNKGPGMAVNEHHLSLLTSHFRELRR